MGVDQIFIFFTGLIAIWITQQGNDKIKKYACLLGMAAQPFWFYATYKAEQWGMFLNSIGYTYCWGLGIYNHWIKDAA